MNRLIVVFILCSVMGWLWESVYCTLRQKKWANRGFLYGPICPIYGFGGCIGYACCRLGTSDVLPPLSLWQIFLAGFAVSMILEYPTSFVLEKLFHARWWDYSTVPLNINGRTSVPTSIAFGLAAILIVRFLMPQLSAAVAAIPEWPVTALSYLLTVFISVDATLTVSALTDFQGRVMQLDASFQSRATESVAALFKAENSFRFGAVKRIAVFKFPVSEKLRNGKDRLTQWRKSRI